jgi:DNA-binding transcriptional ArsR family regulator
MTTLDWDQGTAYDFFISLFVLHHADRFGLRPSWAAGVRQRLSAAGREVLEQVQTFAPVPLAWISTLPVPKDSESALDALAGLPPNERILSLGLTPDMDEGVCQTLKAIASRGAWTEAEQDDLRLHYLRRGDSLRPAALNNLLTAWSRADETGERLLLALREYAHNFFIEEEKRIRPYLQLSLEDSRELSNFLSVDDLVTRLSRGVHFESLESIESLTLVPSYWSAPLVFITRPAPAQALLIYGARPDNASLVPGSEVPDGLVGALKALGDPTRLKILRDLAVAPLTPSELARRLRLRPPTVIHHLRILRLAGLVHITVSASNERVYAARLEELDSVDTSLRGFLLPN